MLLHITQKGRDIHLALTDNFNRELYAEFSVVVRDSQIVRYEFKNFKLLTITFQSVCKYVCSLYLVYLKSKVGTSLVFDFDNFSFN